jgi:hypothetical protein
MIDFLGEAIMLIHFRKRIDGAKRLELLSLLQSAWREHRRIAEPIDKAWEMVSRVETGRAPSLRNYDRAADYKCRAANDWRSE